MRYVSLVLLCFLSAKTVLGDCPTLTGDNAANYNLSSIDREFKTVHDNSVFRLNLCSNVAVCQGSVGCYTVIGGDTTTLGSVTNATVREDHLLVRLYQAASNLTTHITLLCAPHTLGRPVVQYQSDRTIYMVWETVAACPTPSPSLSLCYVYDSNNKLYDLSGLAGKVYHIPISTSSVYFSVCGAVTGSEQCQGGSSCYKKNSEESVSIGHVSSSTAPKVDGGLVTLQYDKKVEGSQTCQTISTFIRFICDPHKQSAPVLERGSQNCVWSIRWRTPHACPVEPVQDIGCRVQARGVSYDLTPLKKSVHTITWKEHDYTIAVCGNLEDTCADATASGCISNPTSGRQWSMGVYTEGNLAWDDTGLSLVYSGGSQCSKGPVRSTKIVFVCDKTAGVGTPELEDDVYCFYPFVWRTAHACPVSQAGSCAKYGTDGELYDLSLYDSDWVPVPTGITNNESLLFSLCGGVEQCPGASLCREKEDGSWEPLASLADHFTVHPDKALTLQFEGAGTCESTKTSLTVDLTCKQGSNSASVPELISADNCSYFVDWAMSEACPAHSVTGHNCSVTDDVTGMSWTLEALSKQTQSVQIAPSDTSNSPITATAQFCGPLTSGPCADMDASVCTSEGLVLGYVGSPPVEPRYTAGALSIRLTGAECPNQSGEFINTIIEFICGETSVSSGNKINDCTYYLAFQDPTICPQIPMECVVTNDTHSYDLSALYEAGTVEWAGSLNGTQMALYVRTCGQVTPGTEGCDHTAGVCAVMDGADGARVALNLGRSSGSISVQGGVISENYQNGGRVCGDVNLRASSLVEYICDKTSRTTRIIGAQFNDLLCQTVVEVASPLACLNQHNISTSCQVTDPLTGQVYDFSYLSGKDYQFSNSLHDFSLAVCGQVSSCGDSTTAGACETINGNAVSLGDSATSQLEKEGEAFILRYSGGSECATSTAGVKYKQTEVTITCNKDTPTSLPRFTNHDSESCVYHFQWEIPGACPPSTLQCTAIGENLKEYDLSVLNRADSWTVRDIPNSRVFYMNVCAASSKCGADGAVCFVQDGVTVVTGRVTGEPVVVTDDILELTYLHGDNCSDTQRWTTTLQFLCDKDESFPVFTVVDTCHLSVEWRTLHACAAVYTTGDNCTVSNPTTGATFDLWNLAGRVFSKAVKEHTYQFTFCTPLESGCNGQDSAGSCQVNTASGSEKSVGQVNKTVVLSNGVILVHYPSGEVCSNGDVRAMTLNLICDHGLSDVEVEIDSVVEEIHCVYQATAYSGLPCEKESLSQCEIQDYDVSALSKTRDNYYTTHDQITFSLNVCRGVNRPGAPCTADSAVCAKNGTHPGISLGSVSTAKLTDDGGSLTLVYTNGDLCSSIPGERLSSHISFICAQDDTSGSPQYLSHSNCQYQFLWTSKFACRDRTASHTCTLTDTLSGETLLNLTTLRGDYSFKDGDAEYSLSLCQELANTPCKEDTALCRNTSGSLPVSLGLYNPTDSKLAMSGSVASVTYNNGDVCTTDDVTEPARTEVTFTCNTALAPGPRLTAQIGCLTRVSFPTSLVCRSERLTCEITTPSDHVINLSTLAEQREHLVDSNIDIGGAFYVSLCGLLPADKPPALACSTPSAGCIVKDGSDNLSTGRVDGGLVMNDLGEVELRYTGGGRCGEEGYYSTRITFVCDRSTPSAPRLMSFCNCEYYIIWRTEYACVEVEPLPTTACNITDPLTGFIYDLQPLRLSDSYYTVGASTSTEHMQFNVCGGVSGCKDAAVCSVDASQSTVNWGRADTMRVSLTDAGQISVSYTGGDSREGCVAGLTSTLILSCCPSSTPPSFITSQKCYITIGMCTQAACQYSPKECDFKIGGNLFNFSPLARHTGNWIATDQSSRTFHLNMCRGVNLDRSLQGCSANSIGCLEEKSIKGAQSVGLVETQEEETTINEEITLSYTGGSSVICNEYAARTQILFSCSPTLGTPTFLEARECSYKFEWKTYVACPSLPVKSQSCSYTHPLTGRAVDLSGSGSYSTSGYGQTVRFEDCGGGGSLCGGSAAMCIQLKDELNGAVVTLSSDQIQLFAEGDTAEILVSSSVRCPDSAYKFWQGVVQYTCNEGGNETMELVALSHCHVIINRATPLVCGTSSDDKKDPARTPHMHFILALCLVVAGAFFFLLFIYFCRKQANRESCFRRIRSILPVRGGQGEAMSYKRVLINLEDGTEPNRGPCDF